ncbi:hypothetical protein PGT21_006055 [Puccinia graminis f. sp. tritici]|uniref:Uncharacterized protein n=1 Tax=Puccinia graminis f. sp. tritici TaxID=56615 RepID=A0A5B0PKH6_PUCGR|nr:hypothetical protein PGT21_006055 [Puccinia graminis f. sp. tritici]
MQTIQYHHIDQIGHHVENFVDLPDPGYDALDSSYQSSGYQLPDDPRYHDLNSSTHHLSHHNYQSIPPQTYHRDIPGSGHSYGYENGAYYDIEHTLNRTHPGHQPQYHQATNDLDKTTNHLNETVPFLAGINHDRQLATTLIPLNPRHLSDSRPSGHQDEAVPFLANINQPGQSATTPAPSNPRNSNNTRSTGHQETVPSVAGINQRPRHSATTPAPSNPSNSNSTQSTGHQETVPFLAGINQRPRQSATTPAPSNPSNSNNTQSTGHQETVPSVAGINQRPRHSATTPAPSNPSNSNSTRSTGHQETAASRLTNMGSASSHLQSDDTTASTRNGSNSRVQSADRSTDHSSLETPLPPPLTFPPINPAPALSTSTPPVPALSTSTPPVQALSTSTPPVPAVNKVKQKLTPADVMQQFEQKTLRELRDLQHTHITYKKLNQAIKIEAQDLYFEYQRKQHLLSLKYRRPFELLTKYLGQRRTRQKQSTWHRFQKKNTSAQKALRNTQNNIGQRNKEVSKLYRQASTSGATSNEEAEPTEDPDAAERGIFGKIFKSNETVQEEVKAWARGVQKKLKELSDLFGVEGFLVLAGQDTCKPFFFQGGSFYGDQYLHGLIDEGDPMREFAIWTAGRKTMAKKRKRTTNPLLELEDATGPPNKKQRQKLLALENRDVCQGGLALNHKYLADEFGKMFTKQFKEKKTCWPGTDTALQLALLNRKLIVKENSIGLTAEHILNVPIKKMSIEVTWLVLRGLKNKWIELVEHQFDMPAKRPTERKNNTSNSGNAVRPRSHAIKNKEVDHNKNGNREVGINDKDEDDEDDEDFDFDEEEEEDDDDDDDDD